MRTYRTASYSSAAAVLLFIALPGFSAQETKPLPKPTVPAKVPPAKTATPVSGNEKPPVGSAGNGGGRGGGSSIPNTTGGRGRGGTDSTGNGGENKGMPTGGRIERTSNGSAIERRPNGNPREVRTPNGAAIHHGLNGNRRLELERADHSRIVAERGGRGYVQHPFTYRGHEFASRTYYAHGKAYNRFYRGYVYRGASISVYAPVRYYPTAYYGWASYPWAAPVVYPWGWTAAANPWYGYYGYYFMPAPAYPSASLWLSDYLISQSLSDAYQSQLEAGTQMQAADAAPITPEVKAQIAAEVQREIVREYNEGQSDAKNADFDPASSGIARLMNDGNTHAFVVGRDLDLIDGAGRECAVSEGDVLQLTTPQSPGADTLNLLVLSNKGGAECRKGLQVSVALPDLQEMQNHMRETIDQGFADMQAHQGQGGLPPAPMAAQSAPAPASFAPIAPPPDPNAAVEISQQAEAADLAEKDVLSQITAPNAAPEPGNISMGMSIAEVTAALGAPIHVFDGGPRKIYTYRDLKITFIDGKVTTFK